MGTATPTKPRVTRCDECDKELPRGVISYKISRHSWKNFSRKEMTLFHFCESCYAKIEDMLFKDAKMTSFTPLEPEFNAVFVKTD